MEPAYCRSFFLALWCVSRPSDKVFSWSGSAWANVWSPNHFTHIYVYASTPHISNASLLTFSAYKAKYRTYKLLMIKVN